MKYDWQKVSVLWPLLSLYQEYMNKDEIESSFHFSKVLFPHCGTQSYFYLLEAYETFDGFLLLSFLLGPDPFTRTYQPFGHKNKTSFIENNSSWNFLRFLSI